MNFVKAYIRPRKNSDALPQHGTPVVDNTITKPPAARLPLERPPATNDSNRSLLNSGTSTPRSRNSQFPEGDFRNRPQDHINLIKAELALEWIAGKQQEHGWYGKGPNQGVVMRVAKDHYISSPPSLQQDPHGIITAAALLNVRVSHNSILDLAVADLCSRS